VKENIRTKNIQELLVEIYKTGFELQVFNLKFVVVVKIITLDGSKELLKLTMEVES
jgi:hypothetical protein